jgi:hypothetical protein
VSRFRSLGGYPVDSRLGGALLPATALPALLQQLVGEREMTVSPSTVRVLRVRSMADSRSPSDRSESASSLSRDARGSSLSQQLSSVGPTLLARRTF